MRNRVAATRSLSIVTAQKRTARRPFQALAAASPSASFASNARAASSRASASGPTYRKVATARALVGDTRLFCKIALIGPVELESIGVDQTPRRA